MNFVRTGFRAIRRNPALAFAEIAWRWAFGAAAWVLVALTVRMILQGVDISAAEVAVARTNDALLIADAIARVLVQVLPRFAAALLVLIPLLAVLWTAAATVGRAISLRTLCERSNDTAEHGRTYLLPLLMIHAVRALFTVATFLAFFGTVFLISAQFAPEQAAGTAPALVLGWMFLALLVGLFWAIVNWFLALAPLFAVQEGFGTWKSIAASVGFYRDHRREYMTIVSWYGFIRGAALLVAVIAGTVVFAAGTVRLVLALTIVVALIYFAFADYLYVARLAAFVALAQEPVPTIADPVPAPLDSAPAAGPPPNLELES